MNRFINSLRGTVCVSVSGPFPERVINLCAQSRVDFWAVDWQDEHTVLFTLRRHGLKKVQAFAQRVDCLLVVERLDGLPEFLGKFKRRYAFLIGLFFALCTVGFLSQFVLSIEINGNENVSEAVILQQLRRFGVRPGAYGPALDRRHIEQQILLSTKELAWMSINLHGTRVEVQVKEVQKAPKQMDEHGLFHIIADADGIITRIEPELGDALVRAGDIVVRGETLISGTVTLEPPQYSDLPNRYYDLHARGRVWARTWRELTAAIPADTMIKSSLETEKTVWSINFFGKRVEFFGNSSILGGIYDKITDAHQLVLPGGQKIPIWIMREIYRGYVPMTATVDPTAAAMLLESQLDKQIRCLIGEEGQILSTSYKTRIASGMIFVTISAECLEEIGQEVSAR